MTASHAMLAKVHVAKKQLGLDDDLYRETLKSVTGHASAKLCSNAQLEAVLKHFEKAGFKPKGKAFTGPSTKYAAKIHALWISGWNLGVIRDNSDTAMEAFILRQTSIAKAQWLKDPKDAAKVIDALKAWLAREGSVMWSLYPKSPQEAIRNAQWVVLAKMRVMPPTDFHSTLILEQQTLGKLIRNVQAEGQV
jgi:phage gp16-like protein